MQNNKLNNDIIQLSGYIYKNVNNKKPENWELIDKKENKNTGFYAEVFKNGNEIAIIYKGTSPLGFKKDEFKDFSLDLIIS